MFVRESSDYQKRKLEQAIALLRGGETVEMSREEEVIQRLRI